MVGFLRLFPCLYLPYHYLCAIEKYPELNYKLGTAIIETALNWGQNFLKPHQTGELLCYLKILNFSSANNLKNTVNQNK